MTTSVYEISLVELAIAFIPILPLFYFYLRWQLGVTKLAYGLARMLVQLLLIGYLLTFIFETDNWGVIVAVLTVMLIASSWISLGEVAEHRMALLKCAFISILVGGGITLLIITQGVVSLEPWYQPRYMIPLAGMIFANSMNTVSLASERMYSSIQLGSGYEDAKAQAFRAAMIPVTNGLLAVGLVSLPGMMTGQILSGVSPLIAARYQIMVMCMITGSAGLSVVIFLSMLKHYRWQTVTGLTNRDQGDR
ncbi:MAG: ABC transporter permease [Motiliproteus sp.]|nr:ABC transporter permease [Motiliproteus sp.]MCW9054286.1 ABC transporter permease [Motiliproteus sp.]